MSEGSTPVSVLTLPVLPPTVKNLGKRCAARVVSVFRYGMLYSSPTARLYQLGGKRCGRCQHGALSSVEVMFGVLTSDPGVWTSLPFTFLTP